MSKKHKQQNSLLNFFSKKAKFGDNEGNEIVNVEEIHNSAEETSVRSSASPHKEINSVDKELYPDLMEEGDSTRFISHDNVVVVDGGEVKEKSVQPFAKKMINQDSQ